MSALNLASLAPLTAAEERELLEACGLRGPARWELMKGDGSQRRFYRLWAVGRSAVAIMAAAEPPGREEAASYLYLAAHLRACGAPVPEVYGSLDAGRCVVVEDLGDTHLEDVAKRASQAEVEATYRRVLERLAHMQAAAAPGLDPARLYQGPRYDRALMVEKESRYFFERYLNGYLALGLAWEDLAADFEALADRATEAPAHFFLHRDFQSRNIMLRGGEVFFVDFQAGRHGPRAYDAASLLIDPYTALPDALQERLLGHFADLAGGEAANDLRRGYVALALQRNLQILGAFSFLGLVRGKSAFLSHIPGALASLRLLLAHPDAPPLPRLKALAQRFR